jgi:hypothetical protein
MKSQVYGPKMSESWRGMITDSVAHLLSFSMPTQSLDFTNHSNGYGHFNTATCRVQQIIVKLLLWRLEIRKRF